MLDPCPKCGSRDVKVSSTLSFGEKLRSVFGKFPVRCRRCQSRFECTIWKPTLAKYARCPRCYRTELNTWNVEQYNIPTRVKIKLGLGATPYRCEHCRCNFASFRPCYERFSWRKLRVSHDRGDGGSAIAQRRLRDGRPIAATPSIIH
jgi:endogenous inhibitor of DNA gyrase (YacG/DUF329 family)